MTAQQHLRRVAAGIRLFRQLPSADRPILLRAWRELLVYRLRVRFRCGFPARDMAFDGSGLATSAVPVDRLVILFNQAAATSVHGTSCLPSSLALRRFLRRYGTETRLRLGTRKTEAGQAGHAWIEYDGRVIGDSEELVRQFVPFHETA